MKRVVKAFETAIRTRKGINIEIEVEPKVTYCQGNNGKVVKHRRGHFLSVSIIQYDRPKTRCIEKGESIPYIVSERTRERKFMKKWGTYNCMTITPSQYRELLKDIEALKERYKHSITRTEGDTINYEERKELALNKQGKKN